MSKIDLMWYVTSPASYSAYKIYSVRENSEISLWPKWIRGWTCNLASAGSVLTGVVFYIFIIVIIVIYHFNDFYIFKLAMILALIQNMLCTCSINSKGLSFGIHQGKLDSWRQIIVWPITAKHTVISQMWQLPLHFQAAPNIFTII